MTKIQFDIHIDHASRMYEYAKEGIFLGDNKRALDGLQEIRDMYCRVLRELFALTNTNKQ